MEAPSTYNVILGRPTLNPTKAFVSTYSLVLKFPTPHGFGSIRGNLATTWYCYVNSLRMNIVPESLSIEELDPRDDGDRVTPGGRASASGAV